MGSCNYTMKCFFFFWFLLCVLSTSMTITLSSSSLVDDNAYIVYMERERGAQQVHYHQNLLQELLGSKEAAREAFLYSYKHTIYGFAAKLTEPQAEKMAELPGVVSVVRSRAYKLHTTRSWDYLGLSFPSNTYEFLNDDHQTPPSDNLPSKTNMGEEIIVGILDTAGTRTLLGSVTNDAPASPGLEGLTPCEIADRYYSYCQKRYYNMDKFCEVVFDNYNTCHGLVDVPKQPGPPPPRHP